MSFDPITVVSVAVAAGAGIAGVSVSSPDEVIAPLRGMVEEAAPQVEQALGALPPEWMVPGEELLDQVAPKVQVVLPPQVHEELSGLAAVLSTEGRDVAAPVLVEPVVVAPPLEPVGVLSPPVVSVEGWWSLPPVPQGWSPQADVVPALTGVEIPAVVFDPSQPRDVEAVRRVLQLAFSLIGVPYQWGGGSLTGPTLGDGRGGPVEGFDCSGLVRWVVYQATGRELPRTSQVQFAAGQWISMSQAQPGDLLFGNWQGDGANHVALYIGDGKMIEAPWIGQAVQISAVRSDMAAVRIF